MIIYKLIYQSILYKDSITDCILNIQTQLHIRLLCDSLPWLIVGQFIHSCSRIAYSIISLQSGKQNSNCNREKQSSNSSQNIPTKNAETNKQQQQQQQQASSQQLYKKQQQQQLENYAHKKKLYKKHVNKPHTSSKTERVRERETLVGQRAGGW